MVRTGDMAAGGNIGIHNHRTRLRTYAHRNYGDIAGLGDRERRSGVTGFMRHGTWTYPRAPFDRAAERAEKMSGRREAA
jgi:hypothetical protein